jgi:hypothetical protein
MAQVDKIDSNATGLRIAEEDSIGVLPVTPVWYPYEPNSYNDFGGRLTTIARNPINRGRQRKKGVTVDLDAGGGWNTDLTQENLQRILQGFFFANFREKADTLSFSKNPLVISLVDGATEDFECAGSGDNSWTRTGNVFRAGDLAFGSRFTNAINNGLHVVSAVSATNLTVTTNLVAETPPADARVTVVGYQFGSADVDIDVSGDYPKLLRASGSKDMTQFGLIPGEWIFLGDATTGAFDFVNAENNGFKRVKSVAATYIEFDKSDSAMVAETGTGLTIRLFFGRVLKNENGEEASFPIVRRSYQQERSLGVPDTSNPADYQFEYLVGSIPNEATFNIDQAGKLTMDLSFVAIDHELVDAPTGEKTGTRPSIVEADAFNTSSDFSRTNMSVYVAGSEAPSKLFTFFTDLKVSISNGVTPNKAVGVLGAFDASAGQFEVSGSLEAYFSNVSAISAVRNNADVTLDFHAVKSNAGFSVDLPLLTLGDGRANVVQDQPIKLPLSADAATAASYDTNMNHTLLMVFYDYLPSAADT